MRDPKRIDRILEKVRTLWKTYPDWRLGQLVVNLSGHDAFVFSIEDDIMEEQLDNMLKGG